MRKNFAFYLSTALHMLFLQAQMRPEGGCSPLRRLLLLLMLLIVLIFPLFAGRVRSASTACAIHVDVEQKMLTLFCGCELLLENIYN